MTPERKSQILSVLPNYRALYLNQLVLMYAEWTKPRVLQKTYIDGFESGYLSLRSVSDLTEEEAMKLVEILIGLEDIFKSCELRIDEHAVEIDYGKYTIQILISNQNIYVKCGWVVIETANILIYNAYQALTAFGIALPYYSITTDLITVDEWVEVGAVQIRK